MGVQVTGEVRTAEGHEDTDASNRVRISRVRAAATHLGASFSVALCATLLVFGVWYPTPLAEIQGVSKLLLVLIGVDVTIGPMMTALIFNPAKGWRLLRFDLMVIVALQTAAFSYGIHAIYSGRPAYLVFSIDRFDLVQAQDVDRKSLQRAQAAGRPGLPFWGPETTASRKPATRQEQQELLLSSVAGGADLPQLPHLYVPYEDDRAQVIAKLRPLDELKQLNNLSDDAWADVLASLSRSSAELGYVPLMGKAKEGAVVVDRKTAEIVKILTLVPNWASQDAKGSSNPTPTGMD